MTLTPILSRPASLFRYHATAFGFVKSSTASSVAMRPPWSFTVSPWSISSRDSAFLGVKYVYCHRLTWKPSFLRSAIIFAGSVKRDFENW